MMDNLNCHNLIKKKKQNRVILKCKASILRNLNSFILFKNNFTASGKLRIFFFSRKNINCNVYYYLRLLSTIVLKIEIFSLK